MLGYDGILLEAMDPAATKAPIEEAEAAGIPVITIDLNSNAVHTLHVQNDDYKSSVAAAVVVGEVLSGTGKYITLNGPASQIDVNQQVKGFVDSMKKSYPSMVHIKDIPIENWDAANANSKMSDALSEYPQIDAVFAASDDLANGAIAAITKAGRQNEIKVYGSGAYPTGLKRIKQGTQFGTTFRDIYAEYQTAVSEMINAISNKQSAKDLNLNSTPVLKLSEAIQVTKDGVYGSSKVDTIIKNSHWDVVLPNDF
jgi:ABC-type sugar transport system substrate-binding protein